MSKKIIIANWKMNPDSPGRAVVLAQKIERSLANVRNVEVVIAPPLPFLLPIAAVLKRAKLGGQNVFWKDAGPYTGEVSWRQLKELKANHVIVGHSERRLFLNETDEMINKKIRAVLENGLTPILCVGERERAHNEMSREVAHQLEAALEGMKKNLLKNLIIAYEPVWAISAMPDSRPDTPENAFSMQIYIRKIISDLFGRSIGDAVRIIYGGSVNAKNIAAFLSDGRMHGALVGSASLDGAEFSQMIKIASVV